MSATQQQYDLVVVGYGFAGGAAAIAAADAGLRVLLLEKMPDPGGISITAGGGIRVCDDSEAAFRYIQASNDGRTPDDNIRAIADGMGWLPEWFANLAKEANATVSLSEYPGNYPLAGFEALQMLEVENIEGFDPTTEFPHAKALAGGTRADRGGTARSATGGGKGVFKVVDVAVRARSQIDVRLSAPVRRLLQSDGRVTGVLAEIGGQEIRIDAPRGVVLACGGFEGDAEMQQQYWQMGQVLSSACRGNTGDGVRMAQALGADLWHMWHFHGTYGFRHPDHAEIGIRMKRLPDWRPDGNGHAGNADERAAQMAWILVDQDGRRFMNEYGPYVQDTGHRSMEPYDPATLRFPRIPAWCVFDDNARQLYPIGSPVLNDRDPSVHYDWSSDNLKEVENGLLIKADSLAELAQLMSVPQHTLTQSVRDWNACVESGEDVLGRPRTSMHALDKPPFYCGRMWPIVSNTQGGPRHDAQQCVVNPYGETLSGLYVAGELGSIWGSLYTSGCNLAECFITGVIAAQHAAAN